MTIKIPLTQGRVAIIDEEDWQLVSQYNWYADFTGYTWYALTNVRRADGKKRILRMHRLILGLTDSKIQADHADGDGLNNQRNNLRPCINAENARNSRIQINNTSGYKGVSWHARAGKWMARIVFDGKHRYLGLFHTKEEAYAAYCKAAEELHGEFANYG